MLRVIAAFSMEDSNCAPWANLHVRPGSELACCALNACTCREVAPRHGIFLIMADQQPHAHQPHSPADLPEPSDEAVRELEPHQPVAEGLKDVPPIRDNGRSDGDKGLQDHAED